MKKNSFGCLGTVILFPIMLPLMIFHFIFKEELSYKPMNSKGRKISQAKKKGWF